MLWGVPLSRAVIVRENAGFLSLSRPMGLITRISPEVGSTMKLSLLPEYTISLFSRSSLSVAWTVPTDWFTKGFSVSSKVMDSGSNIGLLSLASSTVMVTLMECERREGGRGVLQYRIQ